MKLELFYPCKPLGFNQKFGGDPERYKAIGVQGHNGIDFYAPDGTAVRATHDGEVTFTGEDGAGGLTVVVRTLEEFDYKDGKAFFKTIYVHLKKGTIVVTPKQKVKAGDLLAEADNTGWSTGSHLHFGLKPVFPGETDWQWFNLESTNGYNGAIDPEPYFNGKFAADIGERFKFTRNLGMWSTGKDVKELQKRLGVIQTGFFWTMTRAAVKEYQAMHGIPTTGYVGILTRGSLNS